MLTHHYSNANRVYCLNAEAARQGIAPGMGYSDARAFYPDLQSAVADPVAEERFLYVLARWATRYCPWVGLDGRDGLLLDVTGAAHLFVDEAGMLQDMRLRLARAGLSVQIGLADTRGAAWALAHYGEGVAAPEQTLEAMQDLPVAALRLAEALTTPLQRLGVRSIGDLHALPRASLTRRFGAEVVMRLDQALGAQPEDISPLPEPARYRVRLTLPEPIGLVSDVMAGTERLLSHLCQKLKAQECGARVLVLHLRRVDQGEQVVELRLARAMQDALRILPLFERGVGAVDAGFGIDQMRLVATQVEHLPARQITQAQGTGGDQLDDLITRIGNRVGLENIQRFLPADSHIPERSFIIAPAAFSEPAERWTNLRDRPLVLFPPEPVAGTGAHPPRQLRWRRMPLTVQRVTGPERIAPEWWWVDENWHSGLRDYWKVETRQGRRLWMFYTPQNPGWFVQGEFA